MKIFDCFQYFDEDMILIEQNNSNKPITHFIIVENLFMHSGKKKKKNFYKTNLKNSKKK